jgi:ribonucleotide reductase alpha subunit
LNGSIQNIKEIPEDIRKLYRTVWELPQKSIIDLAVGRGPFIDQSQSLNIYLEGTRGCEDLSHALLRMGARTEDRYSALI